MFPSSTRPAPPAGLPVTPPGPTAQSQPPQPRKTRMVGDYVVTNRVGFGSFANVYKAYHRETQQVVAIKAVERARLGEKLLANLSREVEIMQQLAHVNIVRFLDVIQTRNHFYLILDFCDGGDLSQAIKRAGKLPLLTVQALFKQLVSGLQFMRSHRIVHRDLKPQNLLLQMPALGDLDDEAAADPLSRATLKIADFGFARYVHPEAMVATHCGSPLYMAPELLMQREYDDKADLWSIGILLYEMLYGRTPFTGKGQYDLLQVIKNTRPHFPSDVYVPEPVVDLIRCLLQVNPHERIEWADLFSHPWVGVVGVAFLSDSEAVESFRVRSKAAHTIAKLGGPRCVLKALDCWAECLQDMRAYRPASPDAAETIAGYIEWCYTKFQEYHEELVEDVGDTRAVSIITTSSSSGGGAESAGERKSVAAAQPIDDDADDADESAYAIIYRHALSLARLAATDEFVGEAASARRKYDKALQLLDILCADAQCDADRAALERLRHVIEARASYSPAATGAVADAAAAAAATTAGSAPTPVA